MTESEQIGGDRVRVVHAVPSVGDRFGGLATAVAGLGAVEHALGRRPVLLTLDRPEQGTTVRDGLDRWFDVRVLPPGRGPAGRYHGGRAVSRAVRELVPGCDLLVLHSVFDLLSQVAHRVARRAAVPYVLWPHGCLDPLDLRKHAPAKRALAPLWRSALGTAGALLCATDAEAARLSTFGTAAPRRVVPLPHTAGPPADRAAARRRLGLDPAAGVVAYLGRLDPRKGLELLLDAFAAAARPGETLLVAGTGDPGYERALRQRAAGLRHPGTVRFAGWVTGADKAAVLAAADVLALLSEAENFGYVVVEGLAAGAAPLLSPQVALAGELAGRGAAVVVEREPGPAAGALRALLDDPSRARSVVAAGRRFTRDRLSPEAVGERYGRVLAEVCR